ncbi:hypothetical protein HID58_055336, partial [Brassica napus]
RQRNHHGRFLGVRRILGVRGWRKAWRFGLSRQASHHAVPKHQRPPIWIEEAAGFHKRVKRIHDPVKIVVPCDVFEAKSPIPPDKSIQLSSYSG